MSHTVIRSDSGRDFGVSEVGRSALGTWHKAGSRVARFELEPSGLGKDCVPGIHGLRILRVTVLTGSRLDLDRCTACGLLRRSKGCSLRGDLSR